MARKKTVKEPAVNANIVNDTKPNIINEVNVDIIKKPEVIKPVLIDIKEFKLFIDTPVGISIPAGTKIVKIINYGTGDVHYNGEIIFPGDEKEIYGVQSIVLKSYSRPNVKVEFYK